MKCPFCGDETTQVKDSRPAEDGTSIRRRRACDNCGGRFTTYERIQLREITVTKADGSRVPFDRSKILRSMMVSLRKRGVDEGRVDVAVNSIIRQLETAGDGEITTKMIGQKVMLALYQLDKVAYVRYASVYNDFNKTNDFEEFIADLHERMQNDGGEA